MAWTTPRTWVTGEVVTAALGNTHWRDNLRYLKGLDGPATFESDYTVSNLVTAGNVDGVDVSTHKAGTAYAQHTAGAGDHTHQSAGAQGSILDHGLALTGLTDDDHTQYVLESILTTAGDVPYATGASAWTRAAAGAQNQRLVQGASSIPGWQTEVMAIETQIGDGAAVVATGIRGRIYFPYSATITQWTIGANASGSIQLDLWKDVHANYPPTVADTITASDKPALSAAIVGQSSTLTGWTTAIAAGDWIFVNVDSATTITQITFCLKVSKGL